MGSDTNSLTGATFCSACNASQYYAVSNGQAACVACPPGTYAFAVSTDPASPSRFPADGALCQPCPQGTAAPWPGSRTCYPCRGSTYSTPNTAGAGFTPAMLALVNDTVHGAAVCAACPLGTYRDGGPTSIGCQDCQAGQFSGNATGALRCSNCPSGESPATPFLFFFFCERLNPAASDRRLSSVLCTLK
jgi:hypothetical protein